MEIDTGSLGSDAYALRVLPERDAGQGQARGNGSVLHRSRTAEWMKG